MVNILQDGFEDLSELVDELHAMKMRNILLVDPGPQVDTDPFIRGMEKNIYIEWEHLNMVRFHYTFKESL